MAWPPTGFEASLRAEVRLPASGATARRGHLARGTLAGVSLGHLHVEKRGGDKSFAQERYSKGIRRMAKLKCRIEEGGTNEKQQAKERVNAEEPLMEGSTNETSWKYGRNIDLTLLPALDAARESESLINERLKHPHI